MKVCKVDSEKGVVEFCPDDSGGSSDSGIFWEVFFGILGIAVTVAAGIFTYVRVKRRRQGLSYLLTEVERTFTTGKAQPEPGLARLAQLRLEVRHRFERGRLEDNQFLELDKRIGDYIVRLRLLDLEHEFPTLPAALFGQIRDLVADGHLSTEDLQRIEKRAADLDLPVSTRRDLTRSLGRWAAVSAARLEPKARRIAVVAKTGS